MILTRSQMCWNKVTRKEFVWTAPSSSKLRDKCIKRQVPAILIGSLSLPSSSAGFQRNLQVIFKKVCLPWLKAPQQGRVNYWHLDQPILRPATALGSVLNCFVMFFFSQLHAVWPSVGKKDQRIIQSIIEKQKVSVNHFSSPLPQLIFLQTVIKLCLILINFGSREA